MRADPAMPELMETPMSEQTKDERAPEQTTEEELEAAFEDLKNGTFLQKGISYKH